MVHPLALLLDDAAHDRFPAVDGRVHVMPALADGIDVLVAFTGTFALTGALEQHEVDARVAPFEFRVPMSVGFQQWLCERLDVTAGTQDIVFVTTSPGAPPRPLDHVELVEVSASKHSRVDEAARHRRDLRVYETTDGRGVLVLGRGVTGRWELAYELEPEARGAGLGRTMALAGIRMLPEGTPVWAQVAPGNAGSVRALLAAGFRPVGAEVLLVHGSR